MKNLKKNGGFTLVELIVVIAILAILTAVAVPAYSGYIEKANKAGDETLLATINKAFASACMENGFSQYEVDSARINVNADGTVGTENYTMADDAASTTTYFSSVIVDGDNKASAMNASFAVYYSGNESAKFKVIKLLTFANGMFVEAPQALQDLYNKFTDGTYSDQINAYKGSGFYEIGFDSLAGQIDNASGMMAELGADETSSFYNLLNSTGNQETMMSFFASEEEAIALGQKKMEMLRNDPAYADMTDDELSAIAMNQMLANTAVLTAAQNTTAVNDTFISNLANGSAIDALRATTDSGEATADTVAQAALAYAMYTSYKTSKGEDVSGEVDLMDVYDTLESDDFKNVYMSSDQFTADKDGYLAAMKLVSDGASDTGSDLASDILLNGFNSNELVDLMQGVIQ